MNESMNAGIVAGAVAVTAGGGVSIVAEGWPEAVLVALAVAGAFRLGSWLADRRVAAHHGHEIVLRGIAIYNQN